MNKFWVLRCDIGYIKYDFNTGIGIVVGNQLQATMFTDIVKQNHGYIVSGFAVKVLQLPDLRWVPVKIVEMEGGAEYV